MKVKSKRMLNIIVLIGIIINTLYISYAQYSIKDNSNVNIAKTEGLKEEYSILSAEIDKKIDDMEKLLKELQDNQGVLDELEKIQKQIGVNITHDSEQIGEIVEKTPLDFQSAAIVMAYSKKFNIQPSLILAVIKLESNFNKFEVGAHKDRGYMQIIPSTEKWLVEKYGYKLGFEYDPQRIFEPVYNIGLGVVYLSILKEAYGENYDRILSEYNRGPYNLKAYYQKHKTYSTSYSRGVLSREKKFIGLND